jgi:Tfp pilus assembly protein PilN
VILTAFLIGLVLVLAATAVVVIRGIELWRRAKQSGGAITKELSRFEERAARTEQLLADAERANQDLQVATERLRVSRARLQVLLDSIEEAQRRTRWLRVFLPTR